MSQWTHYSTPDPEWTEAVANGALANRPSLTAPTLDPNATPSENAKAQLQYLNTIRDLRGKAVKQRLETLEYPRTGLTVEEKTIPVDGGEIKVRVYTPDAEGAEERFPIMLDFHGGGYIFGNLDLDEVKCRQACVQHRIVAVNVDYRLAPEHPWPIGINDSYAAVKWALKNADDLRVDPKKGVILCGLSAGACFVEVITQRARNDEELKGKITGQILQVPPTCKSDGGVYPDKYKDKLLSYEQNRNDVILGRDTSSMFMKLYKAGPVTHPEVSPLLADSLANLPPAFFQIAGGDPLRDEGLVYAEELEKAGVTTQVKVYPGLPHAFSEYLPQLKVSQKWMAEFLDGLGWLLSLKSN